MCRAGDLLGYFSLSSTEPRGAEGVALVARVWGWQGRKEPEPWSHCRTVPLSPCAHPSQVLVSASRTAAMLLIPDSLSQPVLSLMLPNPFS